MPAGAPAGAGLPVLARWFAGAVRRPTTWLAGAAPRLVRVARRPATRTGLGAALLVAVIAHVGADPVRAGVRVLDLGTTLAALGVGLGTTLCVAARWRLVAHRLGLRLSLPVAVCDYYQAQFLNSVLPVGVLGDAHRAVRHGRRCGDVGRGLRAVVVERLCGQAALLAVAAAVVLARPALGAADLADPAARGCWLAGLTLAGLAVGLLAVALKAGAAVRSSVAVAVRSAVVVAVLSVLAVAGHLTLFVVAARAAGVSAGLEDLLPPVVAALVAMSVPVNVGGWGPREAVAAVGFGAAGFGAQQGVAVAVAYGVLSLVACLPGSVVWAARRPAPRVAAC